MSRYPSLVLIQLYLYSLFHSGAEQYGVDLLPMMETEKEKGKERDSVYMWCVMLHQCGLVPTTYYVVIRLGADTERV